MKQNHINERSFGFIYSAYAGRLDRQRFIMGLAGLAVTIFLLNYILGVFWGIGLAALFAVDFNQTDITAIGTDLHRAYWFNCWPIILLFTPPFVLALIKRLRDGLSGEHIALFLTLALVAEGFVFSLGAFVTQIDAVHMVAMIVHIMSLVTLTALGIILPSRGVKPAQDEMA